VDPGPGQRPYEESPEIKYLEVHAVGGTATAEHSEVVRDEFLGVSTVERGQPTFRTRRVPVLPRQPGETIEVSGWTGDPWKEVPDFGESGPTDPHFTWNSVTGEIAFGPRIRYPDGTVREHGAHPPPGSRISVTRYRTGGGDAGNTGPRTLTQLRTTIGSVERVENFHGAEGGVDAESVENVKVRGPMTLRSGGRAVTLSDFERLTKEADPAVARVRAVAPTAPGDPLRVLVVPTLAKPPEDVRLDDLRVPKDMEQRIREKLDSRRLLGAEVQVRAPYLQGVTVAALVRARLGTGMDRSKVRDRCQSALYRFLDPVPRKEESPAGAVLRQTQGWPYGRALSVAAVRQLLEEIEGVERVDDVLLYEYDPRSNQRIGPRRESLPLAEHHLFLSFRHRVVVK
jgi:predicted phage baseplate assembly protein